MRRHVTEEPPGGQHSIAPHHALDQTRKPIPTGQRCMIDCFA
jgi:hypothetical protein